HSLGGMVAQAIAKNAPDRIEKLVLLATAPYLKASGIEILMGKILPFKTLVTMAFKRAFPKDYPKDKLAEAVAESTSRTSPVAFRRALIQITRKYFFSEPWLPQIKVPTLVIGSENDRSLGYDASKKIQSLVPGAILYTIKGGNHEAQLLHTDEVATAIGKFLGL
ncbi:MAG: alpha/beta fold hydrolase, partial [Candidatus Sigynarchaeota archaeon]